MPPNIVVLLTDQQRADTVAPGPCRTPNIDALASDGIRFERCYSSNPICSPSRASMLTGVLPHVHGMINVTHGTEPYGAQFRRDLDTWPERLTSRYRMGYFGKWHITRDEDPSKFGFDETEVASFGSTPVGYREYRKSLGLPPEPLEKELSPSGRVRHPGYEDYLLYGVRDEPPETTEEYYLYDRGIEFVREQSQRDEPWCAVISTNGPHDPFVPPRECYEQYDPDDVSRPQNFHDPMEDKPAIYRRQRDVWEEFTWREYAEATACYYAFCSHIDDQVGRLVDTLDETGQLEETIILYTSDHGDLLGAHGFFLKGVPAFEEAYRVPLVIRDPTTPSSVRGQVRDELVQLPDLAPTLVEIGTGRADFPPDSRLDIRSPVPRRNGALETDEPPSFTATSLVPFLSGDRPEDHRNEAFAEFHGQDFLWTQRVYWSDDYKYVFNAFDNDELYDLERDPAEQLNVSGDDEYAEIRNELAGRMWEIALETEDYQLSNLHYGMHRFAPVGPLWSSRSDATSETDE